MNIKITDLGFAAQLADGESLRDLFGTPGKTDEVTVAERTLVVDLQVTWHRNFFDVHSTTTLPVTAFRLISGPVA